MKDQLVRDVNGSLTEEQITKLKDVRDALLQFTHFYNLYAFMGEKRIEEFTDQLIEAGWKMDHITRIKTLACLKSNWANNNYVENNMSPHDIKHKTTYIGASKK